MAKLTHILAPLAGYTDVPYRLICRLLGVQYAYTPLIDAGALVHDNEDNAKILKRDHREPWLGVQLLGSIPQDVERSAEMLDDMNFDAVDFNMGCPMQKVMKRPAGAALLLPENHQLAFQCVKIIREKTHRPFTVKLRILDHDDPQPTVDFCKILEELGVEGITIHGRLAKCIYSGPVATHVISAVRESLNIPVTANGGVYSINDAKKLAERTGCDRIMVARGSMGNPWIFRDLRRNKPMPPTHEEFCEVLGQHIRRMFPIYGKEKGCLLSRKIVIAYLKGRGYSKDFKVKAGLINRPLAFNRFINELLQTGPVAETNMLKHNDLINNAEESDFANSATTQLDNSQYNNTL